MHLFQLLIWCLERNRNFKLCVNGVKYTECYCVYCGDLKVTSMLIGQESTHTKCSLSLSLFFFFWSSRAQSLYWIKKQAVSDTMSEGIIHESSVDSSQSPFAFAAYERGQLDALCGGTA